MEFTNKEKQMLLWASFGSLMAAGVGFVFRAMVPALWGAEFNVTDAEVGRLLGASSWPVAIMMILFSLIIDRIGYKISMFIAFALQALSVILTFTAASFSGMWWACLCAGLGHGVVEAAINPLCVSIFRTEKTKYMNILHAAWPAGVVMGGTVFLTMYMGASTWAEAKSAWIFMLLPVVAYGIMFFLCKRFPVDERVENDVPMIEMLKEYGGLGAFLAIAFMAYEVFTQLSMFGDGQYTRLLTSLIIGVLGGSIFGLAVKAPGKPMFFFICLLMVPLATAEIATDGWIQNLMKPALGNYAGWALVFSAFIMMVLRFFCGIPLKYTGPLGLLLISSVFSIIGLFALSFASGILVILAFVFYAVGQTFYWPSVLGLTAEQFPKGGALTLNTITAMGHLTVGIFGFPFLGAVQDHYDARAVIESQPALAQTIQSENRTIDGTDTPIVSDENLFGVRYTVVNADAFMAQPEFPQENKEALDAKLSQTGRSTLRVSAVLPITMALGFFMMLMWFKAKGGYKPIVLGQAEN